MLKQAKYCPQVSIITIVYNNKKFIADTIDSVLNQTYTNIEYIVIDGDSDDGTAEMIGSYGNKITKFISEPDNGIYDAMNKGISVATGDIVGILNSDDIYIDEQVIEKIIHQFEEKIDCVFADVVYIKPNNLDKIIRRYHSKGFNPSQFAYGQMPPHPGFFVKRQIYKKYGVFRTDLKIAADFDILVRFLYLHKIRYRYLPEAIVKMRTGGISTSLSSLFINSVEKLRVCKDRGVPTNIFKILSRYPRKVVELFKK